MSYATVSEAPGHRVTRDAITMMYTRYAFAARYCDGKRVLEVGCGAGQGLGYLGSRARQVVGGDYTHELLALARDYYGRHVPLVRLDAERLPFQARSFDVVILYEAIYYLRDARRFIEEARRVLTRAGVLLICTVNKEWLDFNPSPFSVRYFTASELADLLEERGFACELYAAFPVVMESVRDLVVSALKRSAVRLGLVPKTMKGKEFLKRVFLGRLVPVPPELTNGAGKFETPVPVGGAASVRDFKVLYAVGRVV